MKVLIHLRNKKKKKKKTVNCIYKHQNDRLNTFAQKKEEEKDDQLYI